MHHRQRQNVGRTHHQKDRHAAADGLQNETNERCDYHVAHRSGDAAEAGDCCNCMTRKQVRKQRKKTRQPAVLCGSGQPDQRDCPPHDACSQHDDMMPAA
ncbi:hypothetical protein Xmlh_19500 [Xanthomonas axonopodis pv. melhusii]|uniref:Uncharacterized protein n=1 Tax=Xanthomonas axonopodis pv. melhusii TaxID=487834 RepID=A0A1T1NSJ7_9XANT|nr:hypothetical protein Xmlh_19500 [Xanthomonas axonopodis pv. melhusii]